MLSPIWIDHARVGVGLGADPISQGHTWTMDEQALEPFANRPSLPLPAPTNSFVDVLPASTKLHLRHKVLAAGTGDAHCELPIPPPYANAISPSLTLAAEPTCDWGSSFGTYFNLQAAIEEAENWIPASILGEGMNDIQITEEAGPANNSAPDPLYDDWLGVPGSPIEPCSPLSDGSDSTLPDSEDSVVMRSRDDPCLVEGMSTLHWHLYECLLEAPGNIEA